MGYTWQRHVYQEYSGDLIALYCVHTKGFCVAQGEMLLQGRCCFGEGGGGWVAGVVAWCCLVLLGGASFGFLSGACQDNQDNQEIRKSGKSKSCHEPARTIRKTKILSGTCQEPIRTIKAIRALGQLRQSGHLGQSGAPKACQDLQEPTKSSKKIKILIRT